jgi:hypothetical protein
MTMTRPRRPLRQWPYAEGLPILRSNAVTTCGRFSGLAGREAGCISSLNCSVSIAVFVSTLSHHQPVLFVLLLACNSTSTFESKLNSY